LWLQSLVDVQRETGADVVNGCVEPQYEEGFPSYLKGILLWYRGNFQEKQEVYQAPTGSVLYKRKMFFLRTPAFNLVYGKTGGEDTEFSFFLISRGIKMVKTHQALAYEFQPLERGKMLYYWRRIFRQSHLAAGIHYRYYYRMNGARVNGWLFLKGVGEILRNIPLLLIMPRKAFFRMGFHFSRSLGILAWHLGIQNFRH
ncbi:MAG: hypothetical protein Q4C96_10745, partial [Planctomycetia bacterium]|nr:hypothetical protein [Planctomycetia bacterium]